VTELENYLHNECRGKQNAVTSLILERRFRCRGTEIRSMVNDLRCVGVPICSGRKGYYYADSIEDVTGTVANLESRIKKMREAQKGLLNKMKIKEDEK